MSLVVGHIAYLNCVPFFHHLREMGFDGAIVPGVPSALNAMLQQGQVDICPSSSFEYGLNWRDYLLLPDLAIGSRGPVRSVLLFSQQPLTELGDVPIAITGESATSVNLMRVLLLEYMGFSRVRDYVPREPVERIIEQGRPALLIGDRALHAARRVAPGQYYDLGELWYRHTGLPFLFALWMVRREVAVERAEEVRQLKRYLITSLAMAQARLSPLAFELAPEAGLAPEEIVDYWCHMDYQIHAAHLEGLQHYYKLCCRHELLTEMPELRFFE